MNNSNEIARFRKLHCCISCDTLLIGCTPRMTESELAAGRILIYCYTMHTLVILH